ncbi:F-box/kelch-repeat protein [Dendrobium catenatum]|uniref:F-box/kelch-repeat protein n=1 Tax=Dendrobium catenatum TaxID=906689 RepID=A0A2I0VEN0_9ASPA|nr:F-box/kelch-repeat protein [Dendrobium catenatum]
MAWCDLTIDLLCCISSHLSIVDLVRLSVVCTSWNFTLPNYALIGIQCRPSPWLLLSNDVRETSDELTFRELTIEEEEAAVSFRRRFSSIGSHIYGRRCFGSNNGWLVTLDKIDLQPRLFNPVTKAEISLPSLFTLTVNDLGEYSFFVGCNQTFSLHHKVAIGIKPNCIYFADHSSNMLLSFVDCDIGLFDLYNDRIQYILPPYSRTNWPPSIWFTPSLS